MLLMEPHVLLPNMSALTACPRHNGANTAGGGLNREEDKKEEKKREVQALDVTLD